MLRLQPAVKAVETAAVVVSAAALAGFTGIIVLAVCMRFLLGESLFWTFEAATYLFVYSVFFGCSAAIARGELMGIAELRDLLPQPWPRLLSIVSNLLITLFSAFASWTAFQLWHHALVRQTISPALEIPMAWVYLPLPLGFALMALFSLNLLLLAVGEQLTGSAEGNQP